MSWSEHSASRLLFASAAALCLLLQCIAIAPAEGGTFSIVSQSRWVEVGRVLDGDTFISRKGEHIRLLGINTPEVQHDDSPAQPMGNKATQALRRMIGGKSVRLDFDKQHKDKYGRTLAQVYLRDGRWVNGEMIRLGMAHVYTFTPNLHWAGQLMRLEGPARRQGLGIWKTRRFAMLESDDVGAAHLGQFRVIYGAVTRVNKNGFGFSMPGIRVSVPRKYRSWFTQLPVAGNGNEVIVRGVVRSAASGLYVALHSPCDVEKISP